MYKINSDTNTTFLGTTLTAATPQELLDQSNEAMKNEMAYWSNLLASATNHIARYKDIRQCLEALEHESRATKDIAKAIQAENNGLHADACVCYARAQMDLHFALSSWTFAISEIADDSPLNPYNSTTAEREQYKQEHGKELEQPKRTSYPDLLKISALLHHVHLSTDRICCLGLSITQYQMHHLTAYLAEAEA